MQVLEYSYAWTRPGIAADEILESEVTTIKRRVQVEGNLYFEYEVSPHRAILARRSEVEGNDLRGETISGQTSNEFCSQNSNDGSQFVRRKRGAGINTLAHKTVAGSWRIACSDCRRP